VAGKPLDAGKVALFTSLVERGLPKSRAAKESGISLATMNRQFNDPMSAIVTALAERGLAVGGVPGRESYSKDALRALEDFGFFREYFFARSTNPWAEEAAYKIVELAATNREEYVVINQPPGCLSGETWITTNRAGNGRRYQIADLYKRFHGGKWREDVATMAQRHDDAGRCRLGEIGDVVSSGEKITYTLTTSIGMSIRATADHLFQRPDLSFTRLGDLRPGMSVLIRGERKRSVPAPRKRYASTYTKYHPNQREAKDGFRYWTHRLVMEAHLNGLAFGDYIYLLRVNEKRSKELIFLTPEQVVHHINHVHTDNRLENLALTAHGEHHRHHADETKVLLPVVEDTITSIELWGEEPTYDIMMADDPHSFMADGFSVHNSGKSALFSHDLPAWLACRDRGLSQMIGSASQNLANGYTNRLRNTFERTNPVKANQRLLDLGLAKDAKSTLARSYGRFKPLEQGQWSRNAFDLAQLDGSKRGEKESSFVAYGMDSDYLGGRFDVALWDDLVTKKTLATQESREKLIEKWEMESETRLEPEGLLALIGQRLGPNDLYRYVLDLKEYTEIEVDEDKPVRKYHHIKFKAHYDELCKGDHAIDAVPYPKGCLLDPYRLNWRKLMNSKLNKEDSYRTVYQQEDVDTGSTLVKQVWIDGGIDSETGVLHQGCWDTERKIGQLKDLVNVDGYSVVTVDPSPTKYWAIMWWLYSPKDQMFYLIDMVRDQLEAPDFLDYNISSGQFSGILEEWAQRATKLGRPITDLIMESNAAQKFMNQYNYWKVWQARNGIDITPHQTNSSNKTDEEYGVQTVAPHFRHGRVRLPGHRESGSRQAVNQFVKELTEYSSGKKSGTDDTVMSFWFLVWNAPNLFDSLNLPVYQMERPSWLLEGRGELVS